MDIGYAVKQLDREISQDEQRLKEKKATRKSLYGALSADDKKSVDTAHAQIVAQTSGKPAPPAPIGT
ncbi:MAG TPA: hypothetical protein VJS88_00405 [Chthoniobacterales bacterium]|nr:hypothetical protein [Chthoniobacterales bacterium]